MKIFAIALCFALAVIGLFYLQWWRCGEMFPHAQFACFIRGGK